MGNTAIPFPRPQAYCKRKQRTCEYANMLGYCIYTVCVKSTAEKAEYINMTNAILRGTDNESK